jgi:hypothetical protein
MLAIEKGRLSAELMEWNVGILEYWENGIWG